MIAYSDIFVVWIDNAVANIPHANKKNDDSIQHKCRIYARFALHRSTLVRYHLDPIKQVY